MNPDDVNEALTTTSEALATLAPAIRRQVEMAQQQITHASAAVQACHVQGGAEARAHLQQSVVQQVAAVDGCEETHQTAIEAEAEACEGQGDNPNCLCDEARIALTDQTALCASVTETYEAVYC